MKKAFITACGIFLPGPPVSNEDMDQHLGGQVSPSLSRYKKSVLHHNGIKTRHYAMTPEGIPTMLGEEMAAEAVRNTLRNGGVAASEVDVLSFATTYGDLLMGPGIAPQIQARLAADGMRAIQCFSLAGVCSSSMSALDTAVLSIMCGRARTAVAGGVERSSIGLHAKNYIAEFENVDINKAELNDYSYFRTEFLRWMLSDGAGSVLIQEHPREDGLSLEVEWVRVRSYANERPLCMYAGTTDPQNITPTNTFTSFPSMAEAQKAGALTLRQNVEILEQNILDVTHVFTRSLKEEGLLDPGEIDVIVPQVSSEFFAGTFRRYLQEAGFDEQRTQVFTTLHTRGNVGSASIFLSLHDLIQSGQLQKGQTVLLFVPESARFTMAYVKLKVV